MSELIKLVKTETEGFLKTVPTKEGEEPQDFFSDKIYLPSEKKTPEDENDTRDGDKFYRRGTVIEVPEETYVLYNSQTDLSDEEKQYFSSQGKAYGLDYLRNNGFEF